MTDPVSTLPPPEPGDAVQHLAILDSPNGGSFTLALTAEPTKAISYHPSANLLQGALEALSDVGEGNVLVAKTASWDYDIEFCQELGQQAVPDLVPDITRLKPDTASVVITTTVVGYPPPPPPQSSPLRERLEASLPQSQAAQDELEAAKRVAIDAKREAQAEKGLPPEKSPI